MVTVNRIRALIVLSAALLVIGVALDAPRLLVTLAALLPGAWLGGFVSTTAFRIADARREAARARRHAARRARRARMDSTPSSNRATMLTYA